jgi:two-component system NtrC family response regulator
MSDETKILIIDDDENIRKVVAAILQDKGYSVDTAETGTEAIQKSRQNTYNLMLIDIRLPDMEGVDVLTKVQDTVPKIRKIIVTGYPTLQNAIAAVNGNADAYIMKPFEVEKMLETIKEQLEKQKQERKFSEERVAEFIQTRVSELSINDVEQANHA